MKKNLIIVFSLLFALGIGSCAKVKRGEYAKGTAYLVADDGYKRIMDDEIEVFEYQYPDALILPKYMSETAAIDSLLHAKTPMLAVTSKELTKQQIQYIKSTQKRIVRQNCIAVDAVALIVNKDNPVEWLTMNDIKMILNGEIQTWDQLQVDNPAKIMVVFDNAGSSTVSYMTDKFLPAGRQMADNPNAYAQKNNKQVFDVVREHKNAIGIISVSWLGDNLEKTQMPVGKRLESLQNENDTIATNFTEAIKVLKIRTEDAPEGVKPYQAYINSGQYPLFRKVYLISTGSNSTVEHSFYTFVTGYVGQKIISLTGVMPYHVNPRVVSLQ